MSVCEILPNLWLGSIIIAKNNEFFQDHDIDIVINCSTDIPFYSNYTKNIRVKVNDNEEESEINKMTQYLNVMSDFICKNLQLHKKILVHCYAGKQRSATIIAAYLMKYASMKLDDAIASIKSKRPNAFSPKANFQQSLDEYAELLRS